MDVTFVEDKDYSDLLDKDKITVDVTMHLLDKERLQWM